VPPETGAAARHCTSVTWAGSTVDTPALFPMQKQPSMLRDLAHELRDALSPIRAAVDLMRIRGFDAQSADAATGRIDRGLDKALATIDAFVLAEKYENDAVSLVVAPLLLRDLFVCVEEQLAANLKARCVFRIAAPQATILADLEAARRALTAVLEHAAAAVPDGPLEIDATAAAGRASIRVRLGAQASVDPSWFEGFRARGGGSRLALRTARRIMQLQQGDLTLESRDREAAFVASLPAADAAAVAVSAAIAPERTRAPERSVGAARVVVVDDSPEVRRAYREGLAALGYQVSEAGSAEELLGSFAAPPPQAALIDIHLPGMNGYQLAQALKARGGQGMHLIMLSGMTLDAATQRLSKAAGFDQCFDKAAGPRALHELLQRIL
jgi:CheY-like chemotaxis protein